MFESSTQRDPLEENAKYRSNKKENIQKDIPLNWETDQRWWRFIKVVLHLAQRPVWRD